MRIVALEEHFTVPDLVARIDKEPIAARGWGGLSQGGPLEEIGDALAEVGPRRVAAMDKAGVTFQVISQSGPGADLMPPDQGPDLARAFNDRLKQMVDAHPDRFAGFAHLPISDDPRPGLDHDERLLLAAAIYGGADDLRRGSNPVLGRLSLQFE